MIKTIKEGSAMLVLTRRPGEAVMIGDDIEATVLTISEQQVRIGIVAPRHLTIFRKEVFGKIEAAIKEIIQKQLCVPMEIKSDARFIEDLGADSLDNTEIVGQIEAEFGMDKNEITNEELNSIYTVQHLMDCVKLHLFVRKGGSDGGKDDRGAGEGDHLSAARIK